MVTLCTILHGHGTLANIMARSWQNFLVSCYGSWQGYNDFEPWEIIQNNLWIHYTSLAVFKQLLTLQHDVNKDTLLCEYAKQEHLVFP